MNVVFVVGYHYLTIPIYQRVRAELPDDDIYCFNPKDFIAADVNRKYFAETKSQVLSDPNFLELTFTPPWYEKKIPWEQKAPQEKFISYLWYSFFFQKYKKQLLNEIRACSPDVVVVTSDLFAAPRLIKKYMNDVQLVLVQPCYLDLWDRVGPHFLRNNVLRAFFSSFIPKSKIFGMEIRDIDLLVWEEDSLQRFAQLSRSTVAITHPLHTEKCDKPEITNKKSVAIFLSDFSAVMGLEYQEKMRSFFRELIIWTSSRYPTIIKTHPNEDIQIWTDVVNFLDGDVQFVEDFDENTKIFSKSRVVVSSCSNVGVEARMAGCISINFLPDETRFSPKFRERFETYVSKSFVNFESLKNFILESMAENNIKNLQRRVNHRKGSGTYSLVDYLQGIKHKAIKK